jgi:dTDP-4-amino-4,6-dideoxygalactose transaminase
MERINDALDRRWLTNDGIFVQEFERKVEEILGVRHCVAVCNGTVGLQLTIRALDMTGEVIVPSFTFIATAHALRWQGIKPVFCDVNEYHLDPFMVEQMITPHTTGIVGVHVWGQARDVEWLQDIANRHKLKLMFDAAHAFGCSYASKMIGNFGEAEIFSFHATKIVNCFEGGAITTNSDILANKLRFMRNFGFAGYDDARYLGINGKMNEIGAAMGLTSLENLDEFILANGRNYRIYRQELEELHGIRLVEYDEEQRNNYHYIVIEMNEERAGISRDDLMLALHGEGIKARRYFYPGCHRMQPYKAEQPYAYLLLPNTERLARRVLSLPTGTAVSADDVKRICDVVKSYAC